MGRGSHLLFGVGQRFLLSFSFRSPLVVAQASPVGSAIYAVTMAVTAARGAAAGPGPPAARGRRSRSMSRSHAGAGALRRRPALLRQPTAAACPGALVGRAPALPRPPDQERPRPTATGAAAASTARGPRADTPPAMTRAFDEN